jgi:phage shock protein PspC (stress-responsive transcriptional regulator)
MSTPYPPPPRRLMRDPNKKLIGGVCAGLAKYLNMDVNLVRILAVVITLFTGIPIVLYLIALFVMPEEGATPPQPPYVNGPQPGAYDTGYPSPYAQQPYGAPAQPPVDQVWGPGGAPWEQPQTASPPATSAAAPAPQSWTQPEAPEPTVVEPASPEPTRTEPTGTEPTGYDTAPVTPAADPETPEPGADKKD